ncbi:MAG: sulfopyruvate decarboxylase subunit beta [Methanomassiliicoccus sp.]|nr:sulfopyruvate decarboxylase subunit beta [Methanomassiliicoccus sp.]
MKRIEALELIVGKAGDALVVCNLGYPARELYAVGDRPGNFYMLGSMGLASSIGLGLALARPERRVIVLDGDGSVLMNLGSLSTLACRAPENLLVIILDNGVYGSTGSQPTPVCPRTDLARVASAAGVENVRTAVGETDLVTALGDMDHGVMLIKVEAGNAEVPLIDLTPHNVIERFMASASPRLR